VDFDFGTPRRDDFYSLPRPIDLDELQGQWPSVLHSPLISALASAIASELFVDLAWRAVG